MANQELHRCAPSCGVLQAELDARCGSPATLASTCDELWKRGEELATTGMTGNAKAPMLHFEVRKNSAPVNPASYLE